MSKPMSYKICDTCMNCIHCFRYSDYDSGFMYYCTHNAPERPKCGSVGMSEGFGRDPKGRYNRDMYHAQMKTWDQWCKDRKVAANGKCKKYNS